MGLLDRRPKVTIEQYCQQFYDSHILHPVFVNIDFDKVFWDAAFNSVVDADRSFATVDRSVFISEMIAIRLELLGLAWGHRFTQDKFTIPQSVFTRHYLEDNNRFELWDIMGEYNQAIAQSVTMTETGEQLDAWRIAKANKARSDMCEKWCKANLANSASPSEQERVLVNCLARVANRVGAEVRRADCILVRRLTAKLAYRLGCDPNLKAEALLGLGAVILGFYEGAREAIKDVSLKS